MEQYTVRVDNGAVIFYRISQRLYMDSKTLLKTITDDDYSSFQLLNGLIKWRDTSENGLDEYNYEKPTKSTRIRHVVLRMSLRDSRFNSLDIFYLFRRVPLTFRSNRIIFPSSKDHSLMDWGLWTTVFSVIILVFYSKLNCHLPWLCEKNRLIS